MNNELKKTLPLSRRQIIYIAIALVLLLCVIAYKIIRSTSSRPTFETPMVTVSKAELGSVVRYITAIGTLRPYDSVIIKSEVNSMIKKVNFSEGTTVKEGDLLIELDDTNALASLMEATAQYRKTKSEFEPIEKLVSKGVTAPVQRDMKKAELDVCEARVISYKNVLGKHKIYAPFSGIVGLKEISKGQYVAPGQELLKLVSVRPIKVDFKVAEADIGSVYTGKEVDVLVGGNNEQIYRAKVIAIDPESDRIAHTFVVRAIIENADDNESLEILKPGRFVSVKVAIEGDQRGILVPERSLEKIGDIDILYKVSDGLAMRALVKTGMHRDGMVEIIDGVNDGDTIITGGQQNVLDGKEVIIYDGSVGPLDFGSQISQYYKEKLSNTASATKDANSSDDNTAKKLNELEKKIKERKKALENIQNPSAQQKEMLAKLQKVENMLNEQKKKLFVSSLPDASQDKSETVDKNANTNSDNTMN